MNDHRLTPLQEEIIGQLRSIPGWFTSGDIAKGIRARSRVFKELRSGQLGGPLKTLSRRGLIEAEKRNRKTPMRTPNGRIIMPTYFVFRVTEAGMKVEIDVED